METSLVKYSQVFSVNHRTFITVTSFVVSTSLTLLLGFFIIMTTFASNGDEGYMMAIVKGLAEGGHLYESVYSQYGPFFSWFWTVPAELLPDFLTISTVRLITLGMWSTSCLFIGIAVLRISRSVLFANTALLGSFLVLLPVANEPMHPVGLIFLLLSLVVFAVAWPTSFPQSLAANAIVGVLLGALILTKVNVGLLATSALIMAYLLVWYPRSRILSRAISVGLLFMLLGPVVIMLSDLNQPPLQRFIALIVLSLTALVVTVKDNPDFRFAFQNSLSRSPLLVLATSLAGCLVLVIAATVVDGTSPKALLDGVLLEPLRTKSADTFLFPYSIGVVDLALVGFALAVLVKLRLWVSKRMVQGLRLIGGALIVWGALDPSLSGIIDASILPIGIALPLLWVSLVPVQNEEPDRAPQGNLLFPLTVLTTMAIFVSVNSYPVSGGSHIAISAALALPVGLLALWRVREEPRETATGHISPIASTLAITICLLLLGKMSQQGYLERMSESAYAYSSNSRLEADGMGLLRIEADLASNLDRVSAELEKSCDTFYSIPGLNMFYFFADRPLATGLNANNWGALLSKSQQRQVLQDLKDASDGRVCVVTAPEYAAAQEDAWERAYRDADSSLLTFLRTNRRLLLKSGPFRVFIKRPDYSLRLE